MFISRHRSNVRKTYKVMCKKERGGEKEAKCRKGQIRYTCLGGVVVFETNTAMRPEVSRVLALVAMTMTKVRSKLIMCCLHFVYKCEQ